MPPICEFFYPLHLPCVCPTPAAQLLETRHMSHTPAARTPQPYTAPGTREALEGQRDWVVGGRQSPAVPTRFRAVSPCSQRPLLLLAGSQLSWQEARSRSCVHTACYQDQ